MTVAHTPKSDGPPVEITIQRTPDGWRRTIRFKHGRLSGGVLPWIEGDVDEARAKGAAEGLIASFCSKFFRMAADVAWEQADSDTWVGTVFRVDGQTI